MTRRPGPQSVESGHLPLSPYHAPGFYEDALARGRHRDIVGGRWEETGRLQLAILRREGLAPHHRLLDVGCGSLRLGCKAVPYLDPGNYWGTDLSGALMRQGYLVELAAKDRLPPGQLVEDADFDFPGVPGDVAFVIAFAVFTHLPSDRLGHALARIRARFPQLARLLFTVFLAPDLTLSLGPVRQPDGVVTHAARAPYHFMADEVSRLCAATGFTVSFRPDRLPRGQILCAAERAPRPAR